MENNKKKGEIEPALDNFLNSTGTPECTSEECLIKQDKSLVERINKKIIIEDGRQLLT